MDSGIMGKREQEPTLLERTRDAVVCWWVLLKAKWTRQGRRSPEVSNCLQLKKGTRFRLTGGEIHVLEGETGQRARRSDRAIDIAKAGSRAVNPDSQAQPDLH